MSWNARLLFLLAPMLILGALAIVPRDGDHPTEASQGQVMLWGDSDCSGDLGPRDIVAIIRNLIRSSGLSQTEPCPDIGSLIEITSPTTSSLVGGDLLCDGAIDAVDVLALNRYILSKPVIDSDEPCPAIGESVEVGSWETPTPEATAPPPTYLEGRLSATVEVYLDTGSVPVGSLYVKALFDASRFSAEVRECIDYCYQKGETAYAVVVKPDGIPEGIILRLTGTVASDTQMAFDVVTLTDTEGHPIAGTMRTEPRIIRRYVRGDTNCDDVVILDHDLLPFLYLLVGAPYDCAIHAQPGVISHPGDVDCDGSVTPKDLLLELKYFANGNAAPEVIGCDPIGT